VDDSGQGSLKAGKRLREFGTKESVTGPFARHKTIETTTELLSLFSLFRKNTEADRFQSFLTVL
jgi:hypothetical protein